MTAVVKTSDTGNLVAGMLGILFVGLKLTGYIDWSWWWVTAPFWGGVAIYLVVALITIACIIIKHFFKRA